jgi:hypothetical protein
LENARSQYENLRKSWPEAAYAEKAKERLEDLDRVATKEFYNWFKTARAESLSERLKNLKASDTTKEEPFITPDLTELPDPPERKDEKTPDIKQPENQPAPEKALEIKKPDPKPAEPIKPPANKSDPPTTESKPKS